VRQLLTAAQPPVLRPRLVIRLSPQSAKDLSDVLQNFVANFERTPSFS
jgi:hypothetical protein